MTVTQPLIDGLKVFFLDKFKYLFKIYFDNYWNFVWPKPLQHFVFTLHTHTHTGKRKDRYFNLSKCQNHISYIVNVVTTTVCI